MPNLLDHYEQMSTAELEQLILDDINDVHLLPVDDVLAICGILSRRNPIKVDAQAAYERFAKKYLHKE